MSGEIKSDGTELPPSSFPISSPSFWDEAAKVTVPSSPPLTKVEQVNQGSQKLDVDDIDQQELGRAAKRQHQDHDSTTLSYLPDRLGAFEQDDPHSYLANPEYAPNRFGDIGDYMRKKEIKVQTQNRDIALAAALEGTPQIFEGLSFYINGNTHPPMEEIRKMILQRGGEVRPVLRNKGMVKFIIAPMLTQSKFKQFERYRVVREGWITESCKEGKLLDWTRWKLQIQGGWQESGRKGMEGFLGGGKLTQALTWDEVKSESDGMRTFQDEATPATGIVKEESKGEDPDTKSDIPETSMAGESEPVIAATQSLLRPIPRATPIPISPGAVKAETPDKEKIAPKIHKPEGVWEHYYSGDSNTDAARLMKDQEWRLKNTAERGNEGGFIDGYYQNSRLHHLSTWKAELKVLVATAQKQSEEQSLAKPSTSTIAPYSLSDSKLPRSVQSASTSGDKVIFHVDFDCFFVSCGVASRPHLRGKPVVVCHSQAGKGASSTSEIASASYEARAKGVKNGMSLGRARTLAGNDLQTIPYEFDTYKKFSLAFYTVLMGYADELQAVSVDEALIDVSGAVAARALEPEEAPSEADRFSGEKRDPAKEVAERIRDEVRALTDGCEVSIGIAHNILLAKLATRRAKPANSFHLVKEDIANFIAPLDVEDFPSIGYSIRNRIEEKFGTTRCGDLLRHSSGAFKALLGPKTGEMVYGYLRGVDPKKLEPHKERKSISAEMNYGIRFQNQEQAEICVKDLGAEVAKRMKTVNARGRLLTLKLMSRHPDAPLEPPKFLGHGWCETFNKSTSITNKGGSATDDPEILGTEAVKLLRAMKLDPKELRGVGIQMTKLDSEKPAARESGQGTLSFGTKRKRSTSMIKGELESETVSRSITPLQTLPIVHDTVTTGVHDQQLDILGSTDATVAPLSPSIFLQDTDKSPSRSGGSRSVSPLAAPIVATEPEPPAPGIVPLVRRRSSRLELRQTEAGPSRIATSSDGIDPEFLAALPADLRQEVKQDFARARQTATRDNPVQAPKQAVEATEPHTPPKSKGKHWTAHITKQLRPKHKVQMTAGAIADLPLYGAWSRANGRENSLDFDDDPVITTDESIGPYRVSELRNLGIDPTVFAELPPEMRKEIVTEERKKTIQRKALHRPADRSRLKAREKEKGRTASLSPGKSSRGGSLPPIQKPLVAVSLRPKPSLLKANELPDVLDTVTRWIESRQGAGPAEKDANKVKTYLVKCMHPAVGASGIEYVTEVMKWMRIVLDEHWTEFEDEDGSDVGSQWWDVWKGFKDELDRIALQRLGAPLLI